MSHKVRRKRHVKLFVGASDAPLLRKKVSVSSEKDKVNEP
jgi:hypothetical protein